MGRSLILPPIKVAIVGPKGRLLIDKRELQAWRMKGYRLEGEVKPNGNGGTAEKEKADIESPSYHDGMTLAELRKGAKNVGISGYLRMSKARIIEALNGAAARHDANS